VVISSINFRTLGLEIGKSFLEGLVVVE